MWNVYRRCCNLLVFSMNLLEKRSKNLILGSGGSLRSLMRPSWVLLGCNLLFMFSTSFSAFSAKRPSLLGWDRFGGAGIGGGGDGWGGGGSGIDTPNSRELGFPEPGGSGIGFVRTFDGPPSDGGSGGGGGGIGGIGGIIGGSFRSGGGGSIDLPNRSLVDSFIELKKKELTIIHKYIWKPDIN